MDDDMKLLLLGCLCVSWCFSACIGGWIYHNLFEWHEPAPVAPCQACALEKKRKERKRWEEEKASQDNPTDANKITKLQAEIKTLKKVNGSLHLAAKSQDQRIRKMRDEYHKDDLSREAEHKDSLSEMERCTREATEAKKEAQACVQKWAEIRLEHERMKRQLRKPARLEDKIAELQSAKSEVEKTLKNVERTSQTEITTLKSEKSDLEEETKRIKESQEGLKNENAKLKTSEGKLKKSVDDLMTKNGSMKADIISLEKTTTSLERSLEGLKNNNTSLKASNEELENKNTSLETDKRKLNKSKADLEKEIDDLKRCSATISDENVGLHKKVAELEQTSKEQQTALDATQSAKEQLEVEQHNAKAKIEELEGTNNHLNSQITAITINQQAEADNAALKVQIAEITAANAMAKQLNDQIQAEKITLLHETQGLQAKNDDLSKKLAAKEESRQTAVDPETSSKLSRAQNELQKLRSNEVGLKNQVQDLDESLRQMTNDRDKVRREVNEKQKGVENRQNTIRGIQREKKALEKQVQRAQKQTNDMAAMNSELQDKYAKLLHARSQPQPQPQHPKPYFEFGCGQFNRPMENGDGSAGMAKNVFAARGLKKDTFRGTPPQAPRANGDRLPDPPGWDPNNLDPSLR